MEDCLGLQGRTYIVTGASSGIGRETAKQLAAHGAHVILIARDENRLQAAQASLLGTGHHYYCLDLQEIEAIEPAVKSIVEAYGKISGLAYCAGIGNAYPLKMTYGKKLMEVMRVNFFGFVEMVRVISDRRIRAGETSIVGVSSISSRRGENGMTAYCASKAAMDGAMRAMAHELAAQNIRVNTVLPGWTRTEMYQRVLEDYGTERFDKEMAMQYLGLGEPADVAKTILFLLSDASRFITGVGLNVDGGYFS